MTRSVHELGPSPFSRAEMLASLPDFLALHARRPIGDNQGGMGAPHLFAAWFMTRALAPTHIVESGVFKGLGTWLLEQAAPRAELFCIDPNPAQLVYRSTRARYFTRDFSELEWDLPLATTLLFFDDHQNAFERVELCARLGFEHLIFEDNYPRGHGDCYSLKQALMGEPLPAPNGFAGRVRRGLGLGGKHVDPAAVLAERLATYFEFPPVRVVPATRWGDAWDLARYPTAEPLRSGAESADEAVFSREAATYTWICYARVRRAASELSDRP